MKNFSGSTLHNNSQTANHIRERNNRKYSLLSAVPLRFSLRGYGFCMATLFLFCFCSLFYQLNGGPPKILFDIRQYLGKSTTFFFSPSCALWRKIKALLLDQSCICVYICSLAAGSLGALTVSRLCLPFTPGQSNRV